MLDGVLSAAAQTPSAPALHGRRTRSWRELLDEAAAAGRALAAGGEEPVALLLPPDGDLLVAFLAALAAGRPACVLQHAFTDAERAAALDDAGAAQVLTELPAPPPPPRTSQDPGPAGVRGTLGADPMFYVVFT